VNEKGVQILEDLANIRVTVIAAIEGPAHVPIQDALLADVIAAGERANFIYLSHFAVGIVPGDGIFATLSYRAGPNSASWLFAAIVA